jgi:isoleucyl-tRNA synthetase
MHKVFEKSLQKTRDGKPFVFFEGPPTANAKPALHHVEARAFKDLIPRFQTMRGRFVLRKAGWDTHGLPVELQIEKSLNISGKKQIESIKDNVRDSIIEFNRLCKGSVWQYKEEWEKLTKRMGYWVDMDHAYVTYHNSYIESVWHILKQIWDKGLVYLGHKVVPYCTRCGTALSSHEVAQGYKEVADNSVYVKFRVLSQPNTYILSWTTTPWTLPGNVALAVGETINYVKVQVGEENWILAKDLVNKVVTQEHKVVGEMTGKDLLGLEYEPLFQVKSLQTPLSYKVYPADFVTTTDGTGVVHTAVMYGEDDYVLGEKIGLPKFHTVDETGKFIAEVGDLAGMYAKADKTEAKIFELLGDKVLRVEKYTHEYPHCWRCSTALLYYARDSWFIKMSAVREKLLANNEQVNWEPDYIKHGRFGEWLREVKDWNLSRDRYWGTPLPIWGCVKCGHYQMAGSVADLNLNSNLFYFGRHGQAESNILGIHSNFPEVSPRDLTELGVIQAKQMAERIKEQGGVDMIYASDILRTKHTAEIVGKMLNVPVIYDERLREYNLGVFNGKKLEDFHAAFPLQDRWSKAPEGGETYDQLQQRVLSFVNDINGQVKNKRILVVTHGDVIWLLRQYYESGRDYPKYGDFFEVYLGLPDLHRPYIDDVTLACEKCGADSKRVPAVLDVWFDSGAMPFAQWHYPFENRDKIETDYRLPQHEADSDMKWHPQHPQAVQFPADFIAEAIDQTRGWFYTLLAISTLLDKGPAYKNVISLGHLLDDKGQKMSKSKGNIIDPWTVINKQGVDALRWFMYSVNQPGDSKSFSVNDVDMIVRKNFLTLWNVLSFFVTYAGHDDWDTDQRTDNVSILDKWILIRLQELVNDATKSLDNYDIFKASRNIERFISELSTWYVRRSRDNKGPAVYQTLYQVIKTLAQLLAPFTPFFAERIWQTLRNEDDPESVHLSDWPQTAALSDTEKEILTAMETTQKIVELGHSARKQNNIKVRQPLASFSYKTKDGTQLSDGYVRIVLEELNVKEAKFEGAHQDGLTMEFDLNLTPELKREGMARDLERAVQEMRKKTGLKVGEMVDLSYNTVSQEIESALALFDTKKTFVNRIQRGKTEGMEEISIEGQSLLLGLKKA